MRGKKRPPEERVSNVTGPLPPCKVCGEAAAGFHYGVNTCEACKGFFRRSLVRNGNYTCQGAGSCPVGANRRKSCPKCRYIRCLEAGMSKEAIKTGRYTYQKRTQDTLEIKLIERVKQETGLDSTQLADIKDPSSLLRSSDTKNNNSGVLSLKKIGYEENTEKFISRNSDFAVKDLGTSLFTSDKMSPVPSPKPLTSVLPISNTLATSSPSSNPARSRLGLSVSPLTSNVRSSLPPPTFTQPFLTSDSITDLKLPLNFRNLPPTTSSFRAAKVRHINSECLKSEPLDPSLSLTKALVSKHDLHKASSFRLNENGFERNMGRGEMGDTHSPHSRKLFSYPTSPIPDLPPTPMKHTYPLNAYDGLAYPRTKDSYCQKYPHQEENRHQSPFGTHSCSPQLQASSVKDSMIKSVSYHGKINSESNTGSEIDIRPSLTHNILNTEIVRPSSVSLSYPVLQTKNHIGNDLFLYHHHDQQRHAQEQHQGFSQEAAHHVPHRHHADSSFDRRELHVPCPQPQQHWEPREQVKKGEADSILETSIPPNGNQHSPMFSGMVTPDSLPGSSSPDGQSSVDQSDTNLTSSSNRYSPSFSAPFGFSHPVFKDITEPLPSDYPDHQEGKEGKSNNEFKEMKEITRVLETPGVTAPIEIYRNQAYKHPPSIQIKVFPTVDQTKHSGFDHDTNEGKHSPSLHNSSAFHHSHDNCGKNCPAKHDVDNFTKRPNLRHGYHPLDFYRNPSPPPGRFLFEYATIFNEADIKDNKDVSHHKTEGQIDATGKRGSVNSESDQSADEMNNQNSSHYKRQHSPSYTSKQDHCHSQSDNVQETNGCAVSPMSGRTLPPLTTWIPVPESKFSGEEMNQIIASLVESHRRIIYDTNSLSDEFFESKINECKERCRLQDEVFGHMGVVEYEEHRRIYDSTGLDLDNRLKSFDHVAELMDADIRHIIAFLKTIPGFKTFSLSDQSALVKAAMPELFFMAYYRGYFIDHYIVVEATNTYCVHNMATVYPPIFLAKLFAVASSFRDLKLSFNAIVILKALSVFFPDRVLLEDRQQCETLFDKYLHCFLHQLKLDFPESHGPVMARLAVQLAELRGLHHICLQLWRTEFYQYKAFANRPILMELFCNNY